MKKNKTELLQEIVNTHCAVHDAQKYLDELRSDYRSVLYVENDRFINTWKNSIKYRSMAKLIEEYNSNKTVAKNKMNKTLISRWFKKQPTRIGTLKKFNEFAEFAMEKMKKEEK